MVITNQHLRNVKKFLCNNPLDLKYDQNIANQSVMGTKFKDSSFIAEPMFLVLLRVLHIEMLTVDNLLQFVVVALLHTEDIAWDCD